MTSGLAWLSSTDRLAAGVGKTMQAKPGDRLIVGTATVKRHSIPGRIEELLSGDGQPPYRVRWAPTNTSASFFPARCPGRCGRGAGGNGNREQAKRISRGPGG